MLIHEKLIYTNESGNSVELSLTSDFVLEDFDGRNGLQNNIITNKGVNQLGTTFVNNDIDNRDITLSGKIFEDKEENGDLLIKVCNPLLSGTLKYINEAEEKIIERSIECHVNKCTVGTKKGELNFTIFITCTEPYFKENEIVKELALRVNYLEFPVSFPVDGIEYGAVTNKRMNIINAGDVQIPLTIEWQGVVSNPIITNSTTGEYIKVNTTIASGEKLIIHTAYGNKRVLKVLEDSTVVNAFGLIDISSKFFNLKIGDNLIQYDADSGADESTLFLQYNNQYLGV